MTIQTVPKRDWLLFSLALVFYTVFLVFSLFVFKALWGTSYTEAIPWYPFKFIFEGICLILFGLISFIMIWLTKVVWLRYTAIGLSVIAFFLLLWHFEGYIAYSQLGGGWSVNKYMEINKPSIKKIIPSPAKHYNAVVICVPSGITIVSDAYVIEVEYRDHSKHPLKLNANPGSYYAEWDDIKWQDEHHLSTADKVAYYIN